MKKIVTLVSALLLVSAVSALAATGPLWVKGDYYAGTAGLWGADAGNATTDVAGVWTVAVTSDQAGGAHWFKFANPDWSESYGWNGQNAELFTSGPGDIVHFSLDTNTYADGYQPNTNIVWSDHCLPAGMQFEVMGTSNGWSAPLSATLIGGIWTATGVVATPGPQEFKFRTVGTWDQLKFGAQQGDAGGANATYTTVNPNATVKFEFNTATGRVRATEQQPSPTRTTSFGAIKAMYR
jgi:hypothetical protein